MKLAKGFTIVELLVVIVVIAILTSITVTAYNGVQNRANDSGSRSNVTNVVKLLELYKVQYGDYPGIANYDARMCVGTGYVSNMCNNWGDPIYGWSPSPINDKLKLVGTIPTSEFLVSNGSVGTYVSTNGWNGGGFTLSVWVAGSAQKDCLQNFTLSFTQSGSALCYRNYTYMNNMGA